MCVRIINGLRNNNHTGGATKAFGNTDLTASADDDCTLREDAGEPEDTAEAETIDNGDIFASSAI
jgi:hypothetical protein